MTKFGEFFEGEWQNVLIKSVLVLVVFLILLRVIRKELGEDDKSGKNDKKENEIIIDRYTEEVNLSLLEQVCNGDIATLDGTDGDARDVNGNEFTEADAEQVALGQYDFMSPNWTSNVHKLINAVAPLFESGKIYAPLDREYAEEVVEECAAFPFGENDDLVDSVTQALLRYRQGGLITHPEDYQEEPLPRGKKSYYW